MSLLIITLNSTPSLAAPPVNQWAPQARIPFYDDVTGEITPILIADRNHTVHAFNMQTLGEEDKIKGIVYRQWTLEKGWTDPIDILLNPDGGDIQALDAFLDQSGIVHLAFAMSGKLYYSKSPLIDAGRASAWATPMLVGEQATVPFNAAFVGDDKGNLIIIYAGNRDGNGIYVVDSADAGKTWSETFPLLLTYDQEFVVSGSKAYLGQSGQLHLVWNTINQLGQGQSVYYAKLNVEQRHWTEPVALDIVREEDNKLGVHFPAVIEYHGDILVTNYGKDNGHWWRRSNDGGQTWTDPVRVSPRHIGTNGALSFVVDSSNVLHAFFGQRIDDDNHGMWHLVWTGNGWSEPQAVVRGRQVRDLVGGMGFDPKGANAVISQGNVVLVTWVTDGIAGDNGVWHSYGIVDTPELPVIPLPAPLAITSNATPTLITVATPSLPDNNPSPTRSISMNDEDDNHNVIAYSPALPLIIGITPVVLLISAIIISQFIKHNRH
jgi:hypothetical protein